MDFSNDDELDYEEGDLENDSFKNDLESKSSFEDEINENSNLSELNDQYLQINCSEEEQRLIEQSRSGNVNSEQQNIKKDEEFKEPEPGKAPSPTDQTNNLRKNIKNNNNKSNKTFKKKKRKFQRRAGARKQITNPFSCNKWVSKWNLSPAVKILNPPNVSLYSHQILNFNQDSNLNPNSLFSLLGFKAALQSQKIPQLMSVDHRFVGEAQTFSSVSSVGMEVKCNLNQQRSTPFGEQLSWPSFNKNRSNFQIENDKRIFSRRVGLENKQPKVIIKQEDSKIGSSDQNLTGRGGNVSDDFQLGEKKKDVKHRTLHDQNANDLEIFSVYGMKNQGETSEGCFLDVNCSLKDEEKELLKLKKEARLRRFMNDEMVNKERKLSNSTCGKETSDTHLHLGAEYFQKMEEQKLTRERFLSLKGQKEKIKNSDADIKVDFSSLKPDINKELLLKKKNPFGAESETSGCALVAKIKQEDDMPKEVKQKIPDSRSVTPIKIQFLKKERTSDSSGLPPSPTVVKNEGGSPVRFVRTVSKSFDELAVRKHKVGVLGSKDESSAPSSVKTLPFSDENCLGFSNKDFPAQVESQLTGCIVKVFNIPPTTIINDILALCSPIGIVKEIKINLPKENSVVIRFAEPSCAENFYRVYHGRKMNNYFLNVIVV